MTASAERHAFRASACPVCVVVRDNERPIRVGLFQRRASVMRKELRDTHSMNPDRALDPAGSLESAGKERPKRSARFGEVLSVAKPLHGQIGRQQKGREAHKKTINEKKNTLSVAPVLYAIRDKSSARRRVNPAQPPGIEGFKDEKSLL